MNPEIFRSRWQCHINELNLLFWNLNSHADRERLERVLNELAGVVETAARNLADAQARRAARLQGGRK